MACNPYWHEIQNVLLANKSAEDRFNLCDPVFRMKIKLLLKNLEEDGPLRKLTAFVSVIEFQRQGLLRAHIITFLNDATRFSLEDPTNIDNQISAEIPPVTSPHLREFVRKHKIHAPCLDDPDS